MKTSSETPMFMIEDVRTRGVDCRVVVNTKKLHAVGCIDADLHAAHKSKAATYFTMPPSDDANVIRCLLYCNRDSLMSTGLLRSKSHANHVMRRSKLVTYRANGVVSINFPIDPSSPRLPVGMKLYVDGKQRLDDITVGKGFLMFSVDTRYLGSLK